MLGHLLVDGIAGLALIAIALLVLRFVRPSDEKMAKLAFYAGLAAALTSLAQFVLGMTFNSGMLLALLELTLLLLLVWVGIFCAHVARSATTAIPGASQIAPV